MAAERHEAWYAVVRGGVRNGSVLDRSRFDDEHGIASIRRSLLDASGNELLRLDGVFPTLPTTFAAVLWAHRTARVYAGGNLSSPAFTVPANIAENQLALVDAGQRARVVGTTSGEHWKISRVAPSSDPTDLLGMVLLAQWSPDAVFYDMARRIAGNLTLAETILNM